MTQNGSPTQEQRDVGMLRVTIFVHLYKSFKFVMMWGNGGVEKRNLIRENPKPKAHPSNSNAMQQIFSFRPYYGIPTISISNIPLV